MKNYISKADRLVTDRKVSSGVTKNITRNIVLEGVSMGPKDIVSAINTVATLEDRCSELRLELSAASKAAAEASAQSTALIASLKKYLIAHYGESSPVLADFGFSPRKVAQKSVAEKFQAVEKQLATRAARHTMGSRQKASIHGDATPPATPPVVTQPVAPQPAPQAPIAQPATAPPPVTNGVTQPLLLSLNGAGH